MAYDFLRAFIRLPLAQGEVHLVMRAASWLDVALAWLYVVLRVLHSVVQAMANRVVLRFPLFMAATLTLLVMTIRAMVVVF